MRILFAISVVAFVALLWASISIAQHVRRARQRRSEADAANRDRLERAVVAAVESSSPGTGAAPPPIPVAAAPQEPPSRKLTYFRWEDPEVTESDVDGIDEHTAFPADVSASQFKNPSVHASGANSQNQSLLAHKDE